MGAGRAVEDFLLSTWRAGALFGTQNSRTDRNEVIVLLTATIIRNPQEAANLTDEYGRRFRALEPLHRTSKQR